MSPAYQRRSPLAWPAMLMLLALMLGESRLEAFAPKPSPEIALSAFATRSGTPLERHTYAYDAAHRISDRSFLAGNWLEYEYDDANRMTVVREDGKWRSEFEYDGLGRRRIRREFEWRGGVQTLVQEVRYVPDGMLVLQERDRSNRPLKTHTRGVDLSGGLQGAGGIGGMLATSVHSPLHTEHLYFHHDGRGNVTTLQNAAGVVTGCYLYDPFGNLMGTSGEAAEGNLYRFSSKEFHESSGLYHFGYRYYSPSLHRWTTRDPLGEAGGINLYTFVGNNPLMHVDPWGLALIDWVPDWMILDFDYEGPTYMDPRGNPYDTAPRDCSNDYSNLSLLRQECPEDYDASGLQAVATSIEVASYLNPLSGGYGEGHVLFKGEDPITRESVGTASRIQAASGLAAAPFVGGLRLLRSAPSVTGAADDAAKWIWGQHKGVAKSIRQMQQRGWNPQRVTEAIKGGQHFPAANKVNPANPAIRYVHPQTGQSVVRDTVTKEIIHFGGPGFKY